MEIVRFQCIIRGRPTSEGGSSFWGRSLSPGSKRKPETSGRVMGGVCWPVRGDGGFAPVPPGFSALLPLPMRGLYPHLMEKGCRSIPLDRSRPLSRRSGCFPAGALSSAQLGLIITLAGAGACPSRWVLKYGTLPLGERSTLTQITFPQGFSGAGAPVSQGLMAMRRPRAKGVAQAGRTPPPRAADVQPWLRVAAGS